MRESPGCPVSIERTVVIEARTRSTSALHLYRQMREQIWRGDLPVGSQLPSVRELARKAGVSINTAQRTLAKLQARGLVESSRFEIEG